MVLYLLLVATFAFGVRGQSCGDCSTGIQCVNERQYILCNDVNATIYNCAQSTEFCTPDGILKPCGGTQPAVSCTLCDICNADAQFTCTSVTTYQRCNSTGVPIGAQTKCGQGLYCNALSRAVESPCEPFTGQQALCWKEEIVGAEPESTMAPSSTVASSTVSSTAVSSSTVSSTAVPTSTASSTAVPSSTVSSTEVPSSTVSSTEVPSSTVSSTEVSSSTVSSTAVPTSTASSTAVPSSTVSSTAVPSSTVPSSPTSTTISSSTPDITSDFPETPIGPSTSSQSPPASTTTTLATPSGTPPNLDPSANACYGRLDDKYPHPDLAKRCSWYLVCNNQYPEEHQCISPRVYWPDVKTCVSPNVYQCPGLNDCQLMGLPNGRYPHPNPARKCSSFMVCNDGASIEQECAPGTSYWPAVKNCVGNNIYPCSIS